MNHKKEEVHPIHDPAVKNLLQRMDKSVAESFTLEQLLALRRVVGLRGGRIHSVDARTTVKLPFLPWSFYLVFLAGKNRRSLSEHEKTIATSMLLLLITAVFMVLTLIGLVIIYLLKSWLGINIFEGFSLGVMDWLKSQ
ncbi:hypothetical protein D210916BOD24_25070 [Alteromonas sp. D210916BOD_24]|uniref:hypothetical protein n=1 Tax=Alteromonas sp. D210916BOD_24 TaxID=3157618 RepID=UPI00399CC6C6